MNITFIGMAGAGKSVVGKELAKQLEYDFIDVDSVIEEKYNKTPQELIDEFGDEKFLEIESTEVLNIKVDKTIISPGGSIVYVPEAMEHLKNISTIIYLQVPFEVIEERINVNERGLIGIKEKSLRELSEQRYSLYEKYADIKIPYKENSSVESATMDIRSKIKSIK
jgi:shikimate kinase